MSTLVVVRKNGCAAIASDSLFSQGSIKVPPHQKLNHHKIHRFNGTFIGFTGWSVFHNVFESLMERYPADLDFRSRKHIFETFQKLHRRLTTDFFLETREDDDQPVQSSQWDALIASPTGIFGVSSDRAVYEYQTFWADGSGIRFALGAMHTLYDRSEDAAEIARLGVEAACQFDNASGLPVQLYSVALTSHRSSASAPAGAGKIPRGRSAK